MTRRYFHNPSKRTVYAAETSLWTPLYEKATKGEPSPALRARHVGANWVSMSAAAGPGDGHAQREYLANQSEIEAVGGWEGGHLRLNIGGPALQEIAQDEYERLRAEYAAEYQRGRR